TNIQRMKWLEHQRLHAEQVRILWQEDNFRTEQRAAVQNYYATHPEVIEVRRQQRIAWNREEASEWRRKNPEAARRMVIGRWKNQQSREDQRTRLQSRKKNPAFRAAQAESARREIARRLEQNPNVKMEMNQRSVIVTRQNWREHAYARQVMRTKIAG